MADKGSIDIEALRRQVADGNFALAPHAMQHAVKEGFTQKDMVQAALEGKVVEEYPDRRRCLLYVDVIVEGLKLPLHLVCGHRCPDAPVVFVTAYIPSEEEWRTPTQRRTQR